MLGLSLSVSDILSLVGIGSAGLSVWILASLRQVAGNVVTQHNEDRQAHPSLAERQARHENETRELAHSIDKVAQELSHTKALGQVMQEQNVKNHAEVMSGVKALHQRLDRWGPVK